MNTIWKVLITIGIVVLILGVTGLVIIGAGNDIVTKRNATDKAWSDVESAYQRRLDTIPKFAQVAKFSVEFQLNLSQKYALARSRIAEAGATGNATQLQQVSDVETQGLTIMIQQEAVPEAKTDQLTELNAEIDSVERVINHQRDAFNQAVFVYNTAIQTFPNSAIMGMMGWHYTAKTGFSAQDGADTSPPLIL